jgi:ABC-type uncharacterized transport system substrate-binding protein
MLALAAGLGPAGGALAHPHVFIDTTIEVIFDAEGRAEALRIGWTYDDLFSLAMIADMGLDPDWDGRLTPGEEARLAGFDMNWDPGFAGDTYALQGEEDLPLSRPEAWSARYEGQKITSTHLRRFAAPVEVGALPLVVQVYDPGFYTAYTIAARPVLTGAPAGCRAQAFEPDLDAAEQALLDALAEYGAEVDVEIEFPAVGRHYAEEVQVTCGGG